MSMDSSSQIQGFDWQKLLFSFEGRTRRSHFWIGWLIILGISVVTSWIPVVNLLAIVLIWPQLAISVKRLHDMGKTGRLVLIPIVVDFVIGIFAFVTVGMHMVNNMAALEAEDPAAVMGLIGPIFGWLALMFLVNIAFLLWIGITDSQRGDNKYGPNPKGL
ncbi:DUF805 domain-containing protein [Brevundimonas lenta]|uniref:Uncharacterized membrane protein YhaH (DUF805 family) n=1 Tax=Brevundimonas lenta TaxID=424796 RepID=A0A7W6NPY1_9CAUL|nr:DUF805 domain-containing protein [Brevundimonas lenta]MBB4083880.1 uncharacterized membrane protein YhaH (DUF805 family) [Brevundimonas lenta]